MTAQEPTVGPLQIVVVGFETTERFRGEVARELLDLRGRGMVRVLDARLFHRSPAGELTEIDLNPLLGGDPRPDQANPVARVLGVNGAGGNGGMAPPDAFARVAGFAIDDLRRLTSEIGPGDHAAALLVEHRWAARLRDALLEAGGRLLGEGFLTSEVVRVAGAEIRARAVSEAASELAQAARGAALLEALETFAGRRNPSPEDRSAAAAEVVRLLVARGFLDEAESGDAIDALATAGLVEASALQAATAEAEELLARLDEDPPPSP